LVLRLKKESNLISYEEKCATGAKPVEWAVVFFTYKVAVQQVKIGR
jgi:hypothetical protein